MNRVGTLRSQNGSTQGISRVEPVRDASAGSPRRPRPGRPIHFPTGREPDWKADPLGSAPNRATQGISRVDPVRGVGRAPSAEAQTGSTQGISRVCRKWSAQDGAPHRRRPGRPIHFPGRRGTDRQADPLGSVPNRETQGISTAKPVRGVARAPSAGGRTGLTQGISRVCRKRDAAEGSPHRPRPGCRIHFPARRETDRQADPFGSVPNRETQGISTAKPVRGVGGRPPRRPEPV